jgi:hypothetical protein
MQSQPPSNVARQKERGWMDRNWKWVIPSLCVVSLVMIAAFVGVIFIFITVVMKSSDAYQLPIKAVRSDIRVARAIGSPIREGYFVTGNFNETTTNGGSSGSGQANFTIPISGPKGSATVYIVGTKAVGKWSFSTLVVEVDKTKQRIDINSPPPTQ